MSRPGFRIGLTGPIGAGKSTVAVVWKARGAAVVEGDEMGRLALASNSNLRRLLSERFGAEILASDGMVNRRKLAAAAFASSEAQQDLTRLTFPTLYRLACDQMAELGKSHHAVVFDAALIYEWGVESDYDLMAVVSAPPEVLVRRAAERLEVGRSEAEARLALQLPAAGKERRADLVIMNEGDEAMLRRRADEAWDQILQRLEKRIFRK